MKSILQRTFKYLSIYVAASMDIASAIDMVSKRITHKKLRHLFRDIQNNIRAGKSIKDAFYILKKEKLLDSVSWAIFVSAERSGNTGDAFSAISKNMEYQSKNKMSLIGALAYPVGMFLASIGMTVFLVTVAFPKITPLFKSLNAPIPKMTSYILYISKCISEWGVFALLVSIPICFLVVYIYRTHTPFAYTVQVYLLYIPVISQIILYKEYTSIASSLKILLKNNTTLSDSLQIVIETCSFIPLRQQLLTINERIQLGQKISTSFEKEILFRAEWVDFVTVGEMTGGLSESFEDICTLYQERYKESVQLLVRLSEPIALFCTAVVVLVIALSVITPMYAIIQQVQQ